MIQAAAEYTVLDLFCGAGGLSLGFARAGFKLLKAIDNNPVAIETYTRNLGAHAAERNLADRMQLPVADVIIGGPPCQGFSSAGLRQPDDRRNSLVGRFAEIVAELRPRLFVFENVEGFLTAEQGDRVVELLDPLIEAGYRLHLRKVNAANYGVPQHRKRVIAIGGLGWNPGFPEITHSAYGAPGAQLASQSLPLGPSIRQALDELPTPTIEAPGMPQGHYYRPLQGLELQRAIALKPGQTMKDLPEHLQHESFQRRAFRRVMVGTPTERRGGAPSDIKRLKPDEPSKAITGGACAEFLHPLEHRPLTLRECARLQTFPDCFTFFGSFAHQMQLIGNAVPPLFAQIIAEYLIHDLQVDQDTHGQSTLLSFIPTLSDGMSPVLRHVVERVTRRYLGQNIVQRHSLWD